VTSCLFKLAALPRYSDQHDGLTCKSGNWFSGSSSKEDDGKKEVFFDAHNAHVHPMIVAPEDDQEEYESRRLWSGVTAGIKAKNLDMATDYKNQIEETQRANLRYRQAEGVEWHPRFFQETNDSFVFRHLKRCVACSAD